MYFFILLNIFIVICVVFFFLLVLFLVVYLTQYSFGCYVAGGSAVSTRNAESDVLKALSQIIDPDFGTDIVSCGFVKDLNIDEAQGEVDSNTRSKVSSICIKSIMSLLKRLLYYVRFHFGWSSQHQHVQSKTW